MRTTQATDEDTESKVCLFVRGNYEMKPPSLPAAAVASSYYIII